MRKIMSQTKVYPCRKRGVASRPVDGEAVLVHPQNNRVFVLSRTASMAWGFADGTQSDLAIAQRIAEHFDQDVDSVTEEIQTLFEELAQNELMALESAPTPSAKGRDWPDPLAGVYESPKVMSDEVLEVLAASCTSARTGSGGCKTASCFFMFN
jgi:hypothetical protein